MSIHNVFLFKAGERDERIAATEIKTVSVLSENDVENLVDQKGEDFKSRQLSVEFTTAAAQTRFGNKQQRKATFDTSLEELQEQGFQPINIGYGRYVHAASASTPQELTENDKKGLTLKNTYRSKTTVNGNTVFTARTVEQFDRDLSRAKAAPNPNEAVGG